MGLDIGAGEGHMVVEDAIRNVVPGVLNNGLTCRFLPSFRYIIHLHYSIHDLHVSVKVWLPNAKLY